MHRLTMCTAAAVAMGALCLFGAACTSAEGSAPDGAIFDAGSDAAPPSVATCSPAFGSMICEGTLDPTGLGSGISPIIPKSGAPAGMHYFCYPQAAGSFGGKLLLHVVGTFSDPAGDHEIAARACSLGFAAIAPMYPDTNDVRSSCLQDGACFEGFHREIVYGGDFAARVNVDPANGILHRADTLLARLAAAESGFPAWKDLATRFAARDFSSVMVSGHSQGGGHALYLGREFASERVVMLASPADRLSTPMDMPAPWISSFSTMTKTPSSRLYGFIHTDDAVEPYASAIANWDTLGVANPGCTFSAAGTYANTCRRLIIPSSGCGSLAAHVVVVVKQFNASCVPQLGTNFNANSWAFLLQNP